MNITINPDQRVYVKSFAGGCTAWGFKEAFEQTRLLATRLGQPALAPSKAEFGTLAVVEKHDELIKHASSSPLGTWFREETPIMVRKLIDRLIHTGEMVRIFYGDRETGLSSLDEYDMIGTVGRSTGVLKVPLLMSKADGYGNQLCDDRIIRVIRVSDYRNLYCHWGFHLPPLEIVENEHPDYAATVLVENGVAARFKTYAKAAHWVAFMGGESLRQPG